MTFNIVNFLKLSVHVFCLAEKAKLRRTNSRTNCLQNKITVCRKHVQDGAAAGTLVVVVLMPLSLAMDFGEFDSGGGGGVGGGGSSGGGHGR